MCQVYILERSLIIRMPVLTLIAYAKPSIENHERVGDANRPSRSNVRS